MVKKGAEIKKSGGKIFKIIGFALGILGILLCWVPILNIPIIITSIIGLVFSVVAVKKSEKKKLATAGIILNILAICIGVFILIVIGGVLWLILGTGGLSGSAGNRTFANYSIGEKISSGNMSVTVLSADKSSQIMNNKNQLIPLETTGYFLSVKMTIENGNPETVTMSGDPFAAMDSRGRKFSALSNAEAYYPNSIDENTQFQPGVLFNGIKIFEVPKDSDDLKLIIILTDTEGAYVSLD
ncbi:MAG: DUF4352 domain-containing protein [Candidatus Nanoarchaeia archaeon]|nr:DUF4352 domain-containing protein [Candidatus Nanoarchaeia archaeon]